MMSKKKKSIIIVAIVILSFLVMGLVYALWSDKIELTNKIKIGTLDIDNLNLALLNSNNEEVNTLMPSDIHTIKWTTKNIGTSGALTRHTLEIYWDDSVEGVDELNKKMIYLFPANLINEKVLEEYEKGNQSEYMISTEVISKEIEGKTKTGIKYQFIGDTLDGTSMKNISKEVNYNCSDETYIDKNIVTDDNNTEIDEIAFKVLMNPKTSYLYQGMNVSVKVITEAMQYTEDGSESWSVVDTQEIN